MDDRVKDQSDETDEWLDALNSVEAFEGIGKVDDILDAVVTSARRKGAKLPFAANTAYVNTIPPEAQPPHPGDRKIEQHIRRYVRWNAAAIVVKANKESSELGGHIASFQSAATLYDTGFMHFWHACQRGAWRRPRSISRATARPASTPAPSSRGVSAKSSS